MSKIGRKIIILPEGVNISGEGQEVKVIGPKGELKLELPSKITLKKENNSLLLERHGDDRRSKSLHGLSRSLLANMVYGVSSGFQKKLDFKGVGFKAESQAQKLILNLGFSHPVEFPIPEGIEIKVEKNIINVFGIDKQKVGQAAAEIRAFRPVEPYKGKGIKYLDEIPRRKPGKTAKAVIGGTK
ncbi:MAG TPA: 50S ribosomal protein L6 [Patescibacteria group bacterium]|nr:50S ribosomal protein L6 [Patescibacteria group bacterium]